MQRDVALDERLAGFAFLALRHPPGPGFGADHVFHHQRSGLLDDALGEVGRDDLHALAQFQGVRQAHGLHQILAEQDDHQHIRVAGGSLLQCAQVVVATGTSCGDLRVAMACAVAALGRFTQGLLHAVAPGIVEADVVVAAIGHVPAQVFTEYPGAHPGTVGLAEQVAMAVPPGDLVGVAEGGEVQQAEFAGALAGAQRLFTVGAAEDHRCALVGEAVDVGTRLFRACRRIQADQLQASAQQTTTLVDLVDGKQGATA